MFWYKLITGKESKMSNIMYQCMLQMSADNNFSSPWLTFIGTTLNITGLSHVWLNQGANISTGWLRNTLCNRIKDQSIQDWQRDLEVTRKLNLYRQFKKELCFEKYC